MYTTQLMFLLHNLPFLWRIHILLHNFYFASRFFFSTRFISFLHISFFYYIVLYTIWFVWFGLIWFGLIWFDLVWIHIHKNTKKGMRSDMLFLMQSLIVVQETIHPSEMAATLARYLSVGVSADDDVFADASLTGVLQPPPGDSIVRANFEPLWLTMGTIQVLLSAKMLLAWTRSGSFGHGW